MKDYSLFRQDAGTGNFPPPPPPPPSFISNPPPNAPLNQNSGASTNAIFALVLGILSFIGCGFIAAIPAWIMGKKEINEINAGRSPEAGRMLAKIGMWLGIINLILTVIAIIIAVILLMIGVLNMDTYR